MENWHDCMRVYNSIPNSLTYIVYLNTQTLTPVPKLAKHIHFLPIRMIELILQVNNQYSLVITQKKNDEIQTIPLSAEIDIPHTVMNDWYKYKMSIFHKNLKS